MLFDTLRTLTQLKGADSVLTLNRSCGHLTIPLGSQLISSHILLADSLKLLKPDHVLSHACKSPFCFRSLSMVGFFRVFSATERQG